MLSKKNLSMVFLVLLIVSGVSSYVSNNIIPVSAETTDEINTTDLSGITVGIYEGYISGIDPRVNESRQALVQRSAILIQWAQ